MKEISFLKQNHEKWQRFEMLLNSRQDREPDALADLFIQVTDDLSYAKTFYPNTNTEKYLNGLAARVHQQIYKNKKERRSRLITFWTTEVPEMMRTQRLNLLVATVVFFISVAIGVLSCERDPDFPRVILGDSYVSMTTHNIESGDPMAVYKDDGQFDMFMGIALNNVKVAFIMLVFGLFTQLGPIYLMFSNGVMVGVFQYFFYKHGGYHESLLTIWMHGTIEMLSFIVEAAAGLALAQSLYFPGTYSRLESLKRGGRTAVKISFAAVPLILTAAFFEGFITRYTEMNDVLRTVLIFTMMGFMVWYYVVFPFFSKKKRGSNFGVKIVLSLLLIGLPLLAITMGIVSRHPIDALTLGFFLTFIAGGIALHVWAWMSRKQVEEEQLVIERKIQVKQAEYAKTARY